MLFSKEDLRKLIVPLVIEQLLAVTIGMADTMMVANVGEAAVSGISLVDSLNILLIASNHTDTLLCPEITIYGDDGEQTVPLYSRAQPLPGHGHEHLYFRLPEGWAQAMAGAEEVRLFAAAGDVTGKEKSKLLFLTD